MADEKPIPELSATAQAALIRLSHLLADGYSGKIELECNQGGVRRILKSQIEDFGEKRKGREP